jgi:hypothetical protein
MSKKPMTWLELIKQKLSEEKAKGKSPSIGDVTPAAKKEWVQIKEGKHPLYIQGKAQTFARKKKGENKTKKASKGKSGGGGDMHDVLHEVKLCSKCKKKVDKVLKKKGMKGGNVETNAAEVTPQVGGKCKKCMSGGSCGGSCCGPM